VFVGGLAEIGEDTAALRHQMQATVAACEHVPGVKCVETSSLWINRSYYYNLTHLNQAGHRALAEILHASVAAGADHQASRH
jgi:hypothetical protein